MSIKIHYVAEDYVSHVRVASELSSIIAERYPVVEHPRDADITIEHGGPLPVGDAGGHRVLHLMVDGTHIPGGTEMLAPYDEVWTGSRFCATTLRRYHDRVFVIPHVVPGALAYGPADLACMRRAIAYKPTLTYALMVGKLHGRTKNLPLLVETFGSLRRDLPRLRLILKTHPPLPDIEDARRFIAFARDNQLTHDELALLCRPPDNVIHLNRHLPERELHALYGLASFYVSAHKAEGWGLPMSDAMAAGVPVVATAFSGNLDYMSHDNAFLVPCDVEPVRPADWSHAVIPPCRWGYVRKAQLARKIREVVALLGTRALAGKVRRGRDSVEQYSRERVAAIVHRRLDDIARALGARRRASPSPRPDRRRRPQPRT